MVTRVIACPGDVMTLVTGRPLVAGHRLTTSPFGVRVTRGAPLAALIDFMIALGSDTALIEHVPIEPFLAMSTTTGWPPGAYSQPRVVAGVPGFLPYSSHFARLAITGTVLWKSVPGVMHVASDVRRIVSVGTNRPNCADAIPACMIMTAAMIPMILFNAFLRRLSVRHTTAFARPESLPASSSSVRGTETEKGAVLRPPLSEGFCCPAPSAALSVQGSHPVRDDGPFGGDGECDVVVGTYVEALHSAAMLGKG